MKIKLLDTEFWVHCVMGLIMGTVIFITAMLAIFAILVFLGLMYNKHPELIIPGIIWAVCIEKGYRMVKEL